MSISRSEFEDFRAEVIGRIDMHRSDTAGALRLLRDSWTEAFDRRTAAVDRVTAVLDRNVATLAEMKAIIDRVSELLTVLEQGQRADVARHGGGPDRVGSTEGPPPVHLPLGVVG